MKNIKNYISLVRNCSSPAIAESTTYGMSKSTGVHQQLHVEVMKSQLDQVREIRD